MLQALHFEACSSPEEQVPQICAHPSYMTQEAGARAAEMEAAATKMAGELAEYKAESKELHNQEHTIRRLEDRTRSLEAQLEDKVPFQ